MFKGEEVAGKSEVQSGHIPRQLPIKPKSLLLIFGILAVTVLISVLAYLAFIKQTDCNARYTVTCAKNDAVLALGTEDRVLAFDGLSRKIRVLPETQKDPNLMCILFMDSFYKGDLELAKSDLDQLKKVYSNDVGYDSMFDGRLSTPDELSRNLETLIQLDKSVQTNRWGSPRNE
jgi:hypothetical protein